MNGVPWMVLVPNLVEIVCLLDSIVIDRKNLIVWQQSGFLGRASRIDAFDKVHTFITDKIVIKAKLDRGKRRLRTDRNHPDGAVQKHRGGVDERQYGENRMRPSRRANWL